jgi:general secretion pathway protein E
MLPKFSTLMGRPKRAALLDNGIYDMRAYPEFSGKAALHENGICYVARGYRHNSDFLGALGKYQKLGVLPPEAPRYEERDLPAIIELYEGSHRSRGASARREVDLTAGHRRLLRLIEQAADVQASDLRVIKHDTYTAVRLRVAGREISYGYNWTAEEGMHAILAAFDAQDGGGGEVTYSEHEFQSFSVSPSEKVPLPANVTKLRVQSSYHESDVSMGASMTARLFYKDTTETGSLEDLGLDEEVLSALERARRNLKGAVIIGGETGDGKSTTLVRALERVYDDYNGSLSLVTLEDPVEYRIRRDGVMQIPLKSAGGEVERTANYHKALRNFVRINPDIGMLGEIRDGAGGRELLQFVQSGHAVYSTLHVGKAIQILFRMIALGVPPEEISQTGIIRVLMKQTLVPILCDHCKLPYSGKSFTESEARALMPLEGSTTGVYFRNGEGCDHCKKDMSEAGQKAWAGYQRLVAVGEVIEPDDAFNAFVRANDANGANAHWLKPKAEGGMGGIEIEAKMTDFVLQGQLDPFDALGKKGDLSKRLAPSQRLSLRTGKVE